MHKSYHRWISLLAIILTALACNYPGYRSDAIPGDTPIPLPSPTGAISLPTPTDEPELAPPTTETQDDEDGCIFRAAYVDDITIPDDSEVAAGQIFTKTWRIQNSGTCPWASGTQFAFHSEADIGLVKFVDVPATKPDGILNISVEMLAPAEPGSYRSNWQMQTPERERFGGIFYVKFVVPGTNTPTPTATPSTSTTVFGNFAGRVAEDCASVQFNWSDGSTETAYQLSGGGLDIKLPTNTDNYTWQDPLTGTTVLTLQALDADGNKLKTLTTKVVVACGQGSADLKIEKVIFDPVEPTAFLPLSMTVTLKNTGDVDAGSFQVRWFDGTPANIEACSWWVVDGLSAGKSVSLNCDDYVYFDSYVDIVTEITVDTTALIRESDENNNTKKQTVNIVPPVTEHNLIFLANTAGWSVGPPATTIEFGGEGAGSAAWTTRPLENGLVPPEQCLLTQPDAIINGWVQGTWDALGTDGYTVKPGDVFYARTALLKDANGAMVNFKVLLRLLGSGSHWIADVSHIYGEGIETIWVDLSPYAGSNAVFVLVVEGGGDTSGDLACWLDALIYRHPEADTE